MALRRPKLIGQEPRRALTGATAVIELGDTSSWKTWKFGNRDWQNEAWRLYDIVPEYHKLAGRIGDSLAQARLYVTEVDDTGEETGEVQDERIRRLAAVPLGTGAQRDECLKLSGIDLAVGGECWIVGEGAATNPEQAEGSWFVVTGAAFKKQGDKVSVKRPKARGGSYLRLQNGVDILTRCWNPHPNDTDQADSFSRSAIVPLREIELLTKREFAELDSRLTGAGILPLPEGIEFPRDPDDPGGLSGFMAYLQRVAGASMRDQSRAEAMVPIMFTVPDSMMEHIDKIKPINFWSELSAGIGDMKDKAIIRLASSAELPKEVITGMSEMNHWCKTGETEIYTLGGWRSGVSVGDTVLTLDHETGTARWSPVLDLYRAPVENERLLTVEASSGHGGARFEFTATPEHRHPVIRDGERLIVRGHQLQRGDVLTRGAVAPAPETPVFSDDLVRLVAWYSADGTHTGTEARPRQIRIAKSWRENPDATARMVAALTGVFGPARESMPAGTGPAWRMERQDRGMAVAVLNALARDVLLGIVPSKDKVIPRSFVDKLTSAQREAFLEAWMDSDGDARARTVMQREEARLDAIEYAAILAGRPVRRFTRESSGFKAGTMHGLTISSIATAVVMTVRETAYTGEVWCPVTETGTWLAREPGGWTEYTGNSGWLATEEGIRWIRGYLALVADALTRGFLRLALTSMGIANPERYAFAFDTSMLAAKPNRLEDALKLRAEFLLSDEDTMKAGAFDPEQMPSVEERVIQILLKAVQTQPDLMLDPAIQQVLGLPAIKSVGLPATADQNADGGGGSTQDGPPNDGTAPGSAPDDSETRALTEALSSRVRALSAPTAPALPSPQTVFNAACKLTVYRALELAGGRLTTPQERKGRWADVPRHELHHRVGPLTRDKAARVTEDAWRHVPVLAADMGVNAEDLRALLEGYVLELLTRGIRHHDDLLFAALQVANRGSGLVAA